MPVIEERYVSMFWRLRGSATYPVPLWDFLNVELTALELKLKDQADGLFYPVGLDNGAFVVLNGSGNNYQIDGTTGTLKLLDISDGLFYPIALENGAFVVVAESTVNYVLVIRGTLGLLDIATGLYPTISLNNGGFVTLDG